MRSPRLTVRTATLTLALIVLLSAVPHLRAQERLPNIRRIYVPADAPESWPEGDWTPIPAARLKRALRKSADEPPPGAWIKHARYSATFRDGTLQNGQFGIEIDSPMHSESGGTSLLSWENTNVAFSNLQWEDQPAKLGTSLENKTLLMVPQGQRELTGNWSLRGRPLAYGFQFRLQFPPAAISEVTLTLPRSAVFKAFDQTQWEWLDSPSSNVRTVRLSLGSRTFADFAVLQFDRSVPIVNTPSVFTHAETLVVLSRDQSRIRQELRIEALEAPLKSVTFQLPEGVEIREVELGGRPLADWSVSGKPDQKVLKVNFPQELTGLSRPLRLTGQWHHTPADELLSQPQQKPQEPLTVPRILPRDSDSVFESVTINVTPPLELLKVEEKGYRQTAASTTLDGSGLLTFEAIAPERSIEVRIGSPPERLRTEIVTRLAQSDHRRTAFCELTGQVSSGRLYVFTMELAAGWHPTSIALKREIDAEKRDIDAEWFSGAHWWIEEQENLRLLRVELPRAISRDQSLDLRMNFEQFPSETGSPLIPVVRTQSEVPCDQLLVVQRDLMTPDHRASVLTGWSQIDLDEAPEWLERTQTGDALKLNGRQWSLFSARSPAFAPLPDTSNTARFSARSEDRLALKDNDSGRLELTESLLFHIEDISAPLSTVSFSAASDAALNLWNWNVDDRPEIEVQCLRKTLPSDQPADGQYWELAFVPPLTSPALVTAQQASSIRSDQAAAVLPLIKNSHQHAGRVVVENLVSGPLASKVNLSSELLEQPVPRELPREQPWEATYTQTGANLTIELPDRRPDRQRAETAIHWETDFLSLTSDLLLHHMRVELPAEMTRVSGRWPSGLESPKAWINDVPVPVDLDESGSFQIDWDPSPEPKVLRLEFLSRTDPRRRDYRWSMSLPLPQFDLNLRHGTWSVQMPEDCRISDYSDSLSLIESRVSSPIHWSRRFFGPLGRRTGQEFFRPLDGAEWRSLLEPQRLRLGPAVDNAQATCRFRLAEWPSKVNFLGWSERRQESYAWVCYLLVVMAGVLIRVARWDSNTRIAAWCLALSGLIAWAAPDQFSMFSGAVFAAVVTSVLIPRVFLLGRRGAVQEADTELQFVEGSTLKGLLARLVLIGLILSAAGRITAQSTSRMEPRKPGNSAAETIDVLIPFSGSEPSEQLPGIVYIRESDRQLPIFQESTSKRPVLFTSADYRCRLADNETPTIRAQFQAELPVQRQISMLTIPLSGANLAREGACFVNGEAAPVAITPEGLLEISLPPRISAGHETADPEAPLRAPHPPGIGGLNAYQSETIDIELNLYPPVTVQGAVQQWELQIPSISNSRFRCDYPRAAGWPVPRLTGSRGEVDRIRDGLITADLGKSTRISCQWSSTGFPATEERQPVQIGVNPAVAVKLLPTHLEYRIQTRNVVSEGHVDSLSWHVPDEFHLHKVLSDDVVLQTHELLISDDEKRITFDLTETLTSESSPCVIEAEFLVPLRPGPEDEIVVAIPDLVPSASDFPEGPEFTSPNTIVGLWWPPELPLSVLETSSASIRTLTADDEEWNELWSAEDASRLPTPDRIYELQTPAELTFLRTLTQPQKEALGVYESGTIGDQYLDWEWTAEVETTRLPAFQHEFQIEPGRLEILSVSVLEDRAERVHRWSRGDSLLTVRLTRKTEETPQQITIRGRVPLAAEEELELPAIRLLGADRGESRVDLYLSANRTARWLADERQPSVSAPAATALNRGDLTLFDSFTRSVDDAPQRKLMIGRKTPPPHFERVTTLRRRSDGDFDVSVLLTEQSSSMRDAPLQVLIPKEWFLRLRPPSPIGEFVPEVERLPEGGALITIPPESRSLPLILQTTLSAPKESTWTVPWPGLRGEASYYDLISLRLSDGWAPHIDCRIDPADGSQASGNASDTDRWGYLCDTLELQRTELSDPEAIPTVMQLLATVELQPGEPAHGQWWIFYRGRGQSSLTLESPIALQDVTARINARTVEVDYDPESRLVTLPLLAGEVWQSCFVNWKSETPLPNAVISDFQLQMPNVIDLAVRDSQVILVTHPDLKLTLHHDLKPESAVELRLNLLETFQRLLENGEFRAEDVPDELSVLLAALLSPIDGSPHVDGQPADSKSSLQANRLADLQQELRQMLPPGQFEYSETDLSVAAVSEALSLWESLLPGIVSQSERPGRDLTYFSIPKNPEDSKVWWMSRQWYRAGIAVLIALVLIPASLKIIQNRSANWAVRHRAAVWLMVGLIWWTCLQLSAVGLFIAGAAVIALVVQSVVVRQVRV